MSGLNVKGLSLNELKQAITNRKTQHKQDQVVQNARREEINSLSNELARRTAVGYVVISSSYMPTSILLPVSLETITNFETLVFRALSNDSTCIEMEMLLNSRFKKLTFQLPFGTSISSTSKRGSTSSTVLIKVFKTEAEAKRSIIRQSM